MKESNETGNITRRECDKAREKLIKDARECIQTPRSIDCSGSEIDSHPPLGINFTLFAGTVALLAPTASPY